MADGSGRPRKSWIEFAKASLSDPSRYVPLESHLISPGNINCMSVREFNELCSGSRSDLREPFVINTVARSRFRRNMAQSLGLKEEEKMPVECTHLNQIKTTKPTKHVCEDCVKTGDNWVELRLCLTCGHVGCCDSSKNRHATKHYHESCHPLIRSIEGDENWMWCYIDEMEPGELAA